MVHFATRKQCGRWKCPPPLSVYQSYVSGSAWASPSLDRTCASCIVNTKETRKSCPTPTVMRKLQQRYPLPVRVKHSTCTPPFPLLAGSDANYLDHLSKAHSLCQDPRVLQVSFHMDHTLMWTCSNSILCEAFPVYNCASHWHGLKDGSSKEYHEKWKSFLRHVSFFLEPDALTSILSPVSSPIPQLKTPSIC